MQLQSLVNLEHQNMVGAASNPDHLLARLQPERQAGEYVFCSIPGAAYGDLAWLKPVAMIYEPEGLTLVIERSVAERAGFPAQPALSRLLLGVQSKLDDVGLTAAVSSALASRGISANVIAGCHHDQIFVPVAQAELALAVLRGFERTA